MKIINGTICALILLATPFSGNASANKNVPQEQTTQYTVIIEYISSAVQAVTNFLQQLFTDIQAYFMPAPMPRRTIKQIQTPLEQPSYAPQYTPIPNPPAPFPIIETIPKEMAATKQYTQQKLLSAEKLKQENVTIEQEQEVNVVGNNLIASIAHSIKTLEKSLVPFQPTVEDADIIEIDSPAIHAEKQHITLAHIINDCRELDNFIQQLPHDQHAPWIAQQLALLTPTNKNILKITLSQEIDYSWQYHGKEIVKASFNIIKIGMISAAIGLVVQAAQIGTGNIQTLNNATLLTTGLTAAAGEIIRIVSTHSLNSPTTTSFLSGIGSRTFTEISLIPYLQQTHKYNYMITIPSFTGPLINWMVVESIAIINDMCEKNGTIFNALNNINLRHILISKPAYSMNNELVSTALPSVQAIVRNEKVATVLTQIGWITLQSAVIGGLLYTMDLGYAGTSAIESVGHAALTGVAHGTINALAIITQQTKPGSLVRVATTPLIEQMITLGGATQQTTITATIQAVVEEITNVLIDECENAGGLLQVLNKGKAALGDAINSRWSTMWATISEGFATLQEIEPLPL